MNFCTKSNYDFKHYCIVWSKKDDYRDWDNNPLYPQPNSWNLPLDSLTTVQ